MYERYQPDCAMQQSFAQQMAEKQAYAQIQRKDAQLQSGLIVQIAPHGQLEAAMDSVAQGMQEAFAALDRLSGGLHLVLQPEAQTNEAMANKPCSAAPASPAVNRLHGLRGELEVLTMRMNALRGRLDA